MTPPIGIYVREVGFTGTRKGATPAQVDALRRLLTTLAPQGLHHGASPVPQCADWQADAIARELGIPVVTWPPDDNSPAAMLARNHRVVAAIDYLIACPRGSKEVLRSGTWATVRYARAAGIGVAVICPSGEVL